ncbi:hypothetical protein JK358_26730 [Nocardia sp. 2]|uniref:DUF7824 domain-containing protein n=1 Tax=Nocardia acididurans TaxID=2802282 RepID=A0ABS1MBH7_9NOCA|nr:DUF6493 family protein [Nocardia acididurans]MBL1078005.1 hypothetical protein [Nocardia acididurans]
MNRNVLAASGIEGSGSSWEELRRAIEGGAAEPVVTALAGLDEGGRKAAAAGLPKLIVPWRDVSDWNGWQRTNANLLIAGAACLSGPAAAATWLARTNLEIQWRTDLRTLARRVAEVTAFRGVEWQLELARRLSGKLRGTPARADHELRIWYMAAEIFLRTKTDPPTEDGFVLLWVRATDWPALAADPFRTVLAPKLFDVDAVGPILQWENKDEAPRAAALARLAATGELDRPALIDGCVRRLLRGGSAQQLRWPLLAHQLLAPTLDETRSYRRDYLRLLPTAPSTVADMAFRVVKQLDDADGLDPAEVEEAASALLFRTEKKLLTATLTWLDRTARTRDRVDATVSAVCALFSSESLDHIDRATALAVEYEPAVSPHIREAVRDAAVSLPPAYAGRIAAVYGGELTEVENAPAAPDFTTAPLRPIASLEELAEAMAETHGDEVTADAERQLAALVEFTYRDRERAKTVLAEALQFLPYASAGPHLVARALLDPEGTVHQPPYRHYEAIPALAFTDRCMEIAHAVARGNLPVLLATPTETNGLIDPRTLLDRLRRYEELGIEPGPLDLKQALLRLPPAPSGAGIDTAAGESGDEAGSAAERAELIAAAGRFTSDAARTVVEWLSGAVDLTPEILCGPITPARKAKPWRFHEESGYYHHRPPGTHILAVVRTPELESSERVWSRILGRRNRVDALDELFQLPGKHGRNYPRGWYAAGAASWPSVLPSHPEVIAAHLLAGGGDRSAALPGLALSAGEFGAATATVLAHGLASAELEQRTVAVDALLTFVARDRLPAVELGTAIGLLAKHEPEFKLTRLAASLGDAVRSGAAAALWPTFAVALPALIAGARPGLPDLIALATQSAMAAAAWQPIAEITELANRSGSSRVVREAKRLHAQLEAR